ncbi:hypothetical protein RhiirB3_453370 [Rhizophagus irregularis]|nr:hypothetical protein RhiirB3_453370 [Rhizophagus irregularis]
MMEDNHSEPSPLNFFISHKKLLNHQIYKDLLNSYMDPDTDSEPNSNNIPLPRDLKLTELLIQKLLI